MKKIELSKSTIRNITVSTSCYEAGFIYLEFETGFNYQILIKIRDELSKFIGIPVGSLGLLGRTTLLVNDIAYLKSTVNYLANCKLIHLEDLPSLDEFLRENETVLKQRSIMQLTISVDQKKLIISMSEKFIDEIVSKANSYTEAVVLLRLVFYYNSLNVLPKIKQYITLNNLDEGIAESIISLWKICHGLANLETSLLDINKELLPNLFVQRNVVFDTCITKLKLKFANLDDENLLFMILGLLVFRPPGQMLNPFQEPKLFIETALKERIPSANTSRIFFEQGGPGLLPLVTQAFGKMGILNPTWPDIERIKKLQVLFNSPVLQAYLDNLEETKKAIESDKENPLLLALKDNNINKVIEALESVQDINQYFRDGRTPLQFSIQHCSEEIVKLILKFKPDVNKKNASNQFSPIYAALMLSSTEIAKLLLDDGVDLYTYCGGQLAKPQIFTSQPQTFRVIPIAVALEQYKNDSSALNAEKLKLIIQFGGAIGFKFKEAEAKLIEILPGLDKIVMLNKFWPIKSKIIPITTVEEFRHNITIAEFAHWNKILQRILDKKFITDAKIIENIRQIVKSVMSDNNSSVAEFSNQNTSQASGVDSHVELLRKMIPILQKNPNYYEAFAAAINARNYAKALRILCNSKNEQVRPLIAILLSFKDKLNININERAGKENRAAIHLAALANFQLAFDLLVQYGADVNLADDDGFSATQSTLFKKYEKAHESGKKITDNNQISISVNENKTEEFKVDSSASFDVDKHLILVRRIERVINNIAELEPVLNLVKKKDYSQALFKACELNHDKTFLLVRTLIRFRDKHGISMDLNTQYGNEKHTSLSISQLNNNERVCNDLINAGDKTSSIDYSNLVDKETNANFVSGDKSSLAKSTLFKEYKKNPDSDTNENKTEEFKVDSSVDSHDTKHVMLIGRVEHVIKNILELKPVLDLVKNKDYSQALFKACELNHEKTFLLVRTLIRFRGEHGISIDLNAQYGDKKYTSLSISKLNNNENVCNDLIKAGANTELKDTSDPCLDDKQIQDTNSGFSP